MTKKSDGPSAMMYVLFAVILGIFYIYKEENEEIKKNENITNYKPNYLLPNPINIPKTFDGSKLNDSISLKKFPKVHISNKLLRKENFEYELNKSGIIKEKSYPYLNNQNKFEVEINKTLRDTSKKFDGSLLKK